MEKPVNETLNRVESPDTVSKETNVVIEMSRAPQRLPKKIFPLAWARSVDSFVNKKAKEITKPTAIEKPPISQNEEYIPMYWLICYKSNTQSV